MTHPRTLKYVEHTLNPPNTGNIDLESLHTVIYMSVLDEPITPQEENDQLTRLKVVKSEDQIVHPSGI